jgi:hypothetical protein
MSVAFVEMVPTSTSAARKRCRLREDPAVTKSVGERLGTCCEALQRTILCL